MSHYTVTVITKDGDYDSALAPFSENKIVEPYIYKTKAERIAILRNDLAEAEKDNNDTYAKFLNERYDYSSDEALFASYKKHESIHGTEFDENDNELSTYNQLSKWDWYCLGGRWDNEVLRLKKGGYTNHAQVKDIDFSPRQLTDEEYNFHKRFWEINVEKKPLEEGENENDYFSLCNDSYYIEQYENFETYMKVMTAYNTYAFLFHGEWIEPGSILSFGLDDSTKESRDAYYNRIKEIIDNLDPEDWVSLIDCHI